jgi:transglutaminase-like putative cysteine protease
MNSEQAKEYYENKYPEAEIVYKNRALPTPKKKGWFFISKPRSPKIRYHIQEFITPDSPSIRKAAEAFLQVAQPEQEGYFDRVSLLLQKHVSARVVYTSDTVQTGYIEFWQFPVETLQLNTGDCEDGANLLASLMLAAGVPEWRVRVTCGMTPDGGHAYVTYCRESDNQWVVLDWCYHQDPYVEMEKKPPLKNIRTLYLPNVWWSCTRTKAYGKSSMEFDNIPE